MKIKKFYIFMVIFAMQDDIIYYHVLNNEGF